MHFADKAKKRNRFLSYYKPYRALLLADLVCAAVIAVIALALPICVRYITQDVLESGLADATPTILQVGALMMLLIAVQTACGLFYDYKGHDMGAKIERDMRRELFAKMQKLPLRFFDGQRSGALSSRLTNDLLNLAELYHHGPENLVVYGTEFVGALVILLVLNPKLALVSCAVLPVMGIYSYCFYSRLQRAYTKSREHIADVNAQAEDTLSGIRVVKSFANERLEADKFERRNHLFYRSRANIYKYEAFHFTVMSTFFMQLITVAVVVFGGIWIAQGSLGVADLLVFILYVAYLTAPIPKLAFMVQQYQEGIAGYRRFCEIMDKEDETGEAENAIELPHVQGHIAFEHVAFRYSEEQEYVLRDINLEVKPGQMVAIVGSSGVGKTTLCSLLPRFYEVEAGRILLDGIDIQNVSLASLRGHIGMVQQENFLFAGTVWENIAYGKPDASREDVVEAAVRANAHEFIMHLPNGYDTDIGQRGVKLSGGERQRLSIARVFLKNPPILILDEATSALDYENEQAVWQSIRALSCGRTTIVIAHRLSTVRKADRIVVLTDEGVAEQGTHDALMAQGGAYARMVRAGEWQTKDK